MMNMNIYIKKLKVVEKYILIHMENIKTRLKSYLVKEELFYFLNIFYNFHFYKIFEFKTKTNDIE